MSTAMFNPGLVKHASKLTGALVILCILLWAGESPATTVREASVTELVDKSAVIFEGVVVDVRARKTMRGSIVTDVVFEVIDVIKGRIPQKRLSIEFLGGEVQGEKLSISAMHYPALGEKGIYFAESIDHPMINPLYGWDQGRFLLQTDQAGEERVFTAGRRPVVEVNGDTFTFPGKTAREAGFSSGIARGVLTAKPAMVDQGMSKRQFKQRIRSLAAGAP